VPVELGGARGHGPGYGDAPPRLGEADPIDLGDRFARAPVLSRSGEIAVRRPELIVGLSVLVDQPDDLVVVAGRVAREPGRDDGVDGTAPDLGQFEAAPGERAPDQIETLAL